MKFPPAALRARLGRLAREAHPDFLHSQSSAHLLLLRFSSIVIRLPPASLAGTARCLHRVVSRCAAEDGAEEREGEREGICAAASTMRRADEPEA